MPKLDIQMDTTVAEPDIQVAPDIDVDFDSDFDEDLDSDKPWHVVLLDDDYHTYAYVIEMLGKIFGYSKTKAFRMAREVDKKKRVIVWTGHREIAELKQEQIHDYGADWRMDTSQGSMSAILEQAR